MGLDFLLSEKFIKLMRLLLALTVSLVVISTIPLQANEFNIRFYTILLAFTLTYCLKIFYNSKPTSILLGIACISYGFYLNGFSKAYQLPAISVIILGFYILTSRFFEKDCKPKLKTSKK